MKGSSPSHNTLGFHIRILLIIRLGQLAFFNLKFFLGVGEDLWSAVNCRILTLGVRVPPKVPRLFFCEGSTSQIQGRLYKSTTGG